MERLIYLLLSACVLVGCSSANRIVVRDGEEQGLKSIRLVQFPKAWTEGGENGITSSSFKAVSTIYLMEEKTAVRPQVTVEIDLPKQVNVNKSEGAIIMILDNEEIPLKFPVSGIDSLQRGAGIPSGVKFCQKYLIAENLWISILHAKKITYRVSLEEKTSVHILLNQKERGKLSEFMNMTIRQRDLRFPAVPEGQVKW